ncbi:MAG: Calx-beta domain-containing protein, partial [Candidatus Rokuibacteriota bacterium]
VQYATADGTATAGSDYTAISLTPLTFAPGETSKPVTVLVNGDTSTEPNETFFVNLSSATNATIADSQGLGTITNDDAASGSITVVSPNGGNTWRINTTKTIHWTSSGVSGTVLVELSRDNGTNWVTLLPDTPNDGAQKWKVTAPATTLARVRVCNLTRTVCDESNAPFTIR